MIYWFFLTPALSKGEGDWADILCDFFYSNLKTLKLQSLCLYRRNHDRVYNVVNRTTTA